jgi:nucleotide-binding universal stress UspA family protein
MGVIAERVARPGAAAEDGVAPGLPRRILVPLDFSRHADSGVRAAADLAWRLGAELVAVHAVPDEELRAIARSRLTRRGLDQILEDLGQAVEDHVLMLIDSAQAVGLPVQGLAVSGQPAEGILRAAWLMGCDLIVMATHGRTGLSHTVIGSVAETVVRRASCPVLTLRPVPH